MHTPVRCSGRLGGGGVCLGGVGGVCPDPEADPPPPWTEWQMLVTEYFTFSEIDAMGFYFTFVYRLHISQVTFLGLPENLELPANIGLTR